MHVRRLPYARSFSALLAAACLTAGALPVAVHAVDNPQNYSTNPSSNQVVVTENDRPVTVVTQQVSNDNGTGYRIVGTAGNGGSGGFVMTLTSGGLGGSTGSGGGFGGGSGGGFGGNGGSGGTGGIPISGGGTADASGRGLQPNSDARLSLFGPVNTSPTSLPLQARAGSTPKTYQLGATTVKSDGTFTISEPVPAGLPVGDYEMKVTGTASTGLPLVVKLPAVVTTSTAQAATRVFFAVDSAVLTDEAKADLDRVVRKVPAKSRTKASVAVTGFVQPTDSTSNDKALSTARAKAVAAYLKGAGLKGAYTVSGEGRAKQTGATARRVDVQAVYAK